MDFSSAESGPGSPTSPARRRVRKKLVAWHCATSKDVERMMTPLRMATWQREREGAPSCRAK
jgi:hypothetical protein